MNIDSALLKLPDTLKEKKMQSNYCMLRVVDDDTDSPFKIVPDEFEPKNEDEVVPNWCV